MGEAKNRQGGHLEIQTEALHLCTYVCAGDCGGVWNDFMYVTIR